MSVFSSSTSSSALNDNNNSAPIRCQICANSTNPQIPPEAQLIPGTQLNNHVADHFHYRPHQCKLCGFATNKSEELEQHGQQSQHHLHVQLFSARNAFVEEFLNVLVEECKRRSKQNMPGVIVACSSTIGNEEPTNQQISAFSPQSISPIPSLTPREDQQQTQRADEPQQQQQQTQQQQKQQQQQEQQPKQQLKQQQLPQQKQQQPKQQPKQLQLPQQQCQRQQQRCSTSTTSINFYNHENQPLMKERTVVGPSSVALLQLKSRLATIASSAVEHLAHGDNCVEKTNQIFASGTNDAMVNPSPNSAMAAEEEVPVLAPSVPAVNEKAPAANVGPLVSSSIVSSILPLKCLLCGKITANYAVREYHCNTHLDLALYRCLICSQDFKQYNEWRHHIKYFHQIKNTPKEMVHVIGQNVERVKREAKQMYGPVRNAAPIRAQHQHMDTVPPATTTITSTAISPTASATPITVLSAPLSASSSCDQSQQTNTANRKNLHRLSKVQCMECRELVLDSSHYRLKHTNARHLKLWLSQCTICHLKFMSTFAGHTNSIRNHFRAKHRGADVDQALLEAPDLGQKMQQIRAQHDRFFGELSLN